MCGIGNDAGEMVRMRQIRLKWIKLNNQIHQENNQVLVMKDELCSSSVFTEVSLL